MLSPVPAEEERESPINGKCRVCVYVGWNVLRPLTQSFLFFTDILGRSDRVPWCILSSMLSPKHEKRVKYVSGKPTKERQTALRS